MKVWCPPHRPLVSLPLPWLHQPFTAKLAGEHQDQAWEITQRLPGPFHTHGLYTYCVPGLGELVLVSRSWVSPGRNSHL